MSYRIYFSKYQQIETVLVELSKNKSIHYEGNISFQMHLMILRLGFNLISSSQKVVGNRGLADPDAEVWILSLIIIYIYLFNSHTFNFLFLLFHWLHKSCTTLKHGDIKQLVIDLDIFFYNIVKLLPY